MTERVTTWVCDDGNAEVTISADTREDAAKEYVDGGEWGEVEKTTWINVWVWPEGDPEDRDQVKMAIDPPEPDCSEEEHEWVAPYSIVGGCESNPGVWGSGGGVVIREVCAHCGLGRRINTWAQDPQDGVQGLVSIEYSEEYISAWEAWKELEQADEDEEDEEE